jgi:hypothetical protein
MLPVDATRCGVGEPNRECQSRRVPVGMDGEPGDHRNGEPLISTRGRTGTYPPRPPQRAAVNPSFAHPRRLRLGARSSANGSEPRAPPSDMSHMSPWHMMRSDWLWAFGAIHGAGRDERDPRTFRPAAVATGGRDGWQHRSASLRRRRVRSAYTPPPDEYH